MGRIRVLADPLIDRIAAGEVVERPASVVKELVENSLDAGARTVEVRLERGGKHSIRISDDGCGMDRDDALLAVERHATSKLATENDLDAIATLGFRGEALSSIASVSRLTLSTSTSAGSGTEVVVHGGRIQSVREVGLPPGTTLQIDRLFYNVPARRKFLKAESTELSHALRWLTRYALVHPDRHFSLRHGDRTLLDAVACDDTRHRIGQIHGREFADKLLPFEGREETARVHGFAGRPVDALPRRDAQHVFVNGRAVQDRVLGHAILQAYENTMARGRYPALFLFVELDPEEVDVNVHPQKTEVRFSQSSRVHDLVRDAIAASLSDERAVPSLGELRPHSVPGADAVRDSTLRYLEAGPGAEGTFASGGMSSPAPRHGPSGFPAPRVSADGELFGTDVDDEAPGDVVQAAALAQFMDSYVVAQDREGLILIDQHAAHERVLFERYLADAESGQVELQRLLFPVTVELTAAESAVLESELDEFRRLGFHVEPFGGNTVRLEAVPAVAARVDAEGLLRELLGEAGEARSAASAAGDLRRKLITSAACQAAIKVNHPLTVPAMQRLIDDLYRTDSPTSCPHGRPALFRLTLDEIERAFRRR